MKRNHLLFGAVVLATSFSAFAGAFPSQAQIMAGPGMGKAQPPKPAAPPPPALPGAQSDSERVAPAEKQVTDMPPTDALFDAINRGDIATARDAISRGADLNGHNLLGMTPLELSVDLGRNNISFLLLSLRGSEGGARPTAHAADTSAAAKRQQLQADRRAEQQARQTERQTARQAARAPVREATPHAPQAPRLFAGDGGAPIPASGFLGFDAARGGSAR